MESARIEIEELLRESRWLRRLAGHLVADPAEADDVAQQTYLAALASPPPVERAVRPWLALVARNVIRSRFRADRRRSRREQAAADRADVVAPDQLLERVELQRLLAELVAGLPEPYRAVIVLRFYRDRSAAEIAAAEQVPAATIRWRIQRGLELLRAGLDRRHGGKRADWKPTLAGFAGLPRRTRPGPGTAAMGTVASIAAKLGLLAGAALTLCAVAALAITPRGGASPAAAATPRPSPEQGSSSPAAIRATRPVVGRPSGARSIDESPGRAGPRDRRGDRPVRVGPFESRRGPAGAEPLVTEVALPLSSVDVQGRTEELAPLFDECVDAALERNPRLKGGAVLEIAVVADPEVGAQVESAELRPVIGDPPDEELVECVRETSFAVELERPDWFVGRTVFRFPALLGPAAEQDMKDISMAVFLRVRELGRSSY